MRDKQFYVSTDVYRAYWTLSNSYVPGEGARKTPDEIVDRVLRKYIEDKFPQIFAHQKEVNALEKQLIEQLTNGRSN